MKRQDDQEIQNIFRPLIGQKPWRVELGIGSFVTLEFGNVIYDDKVPGRPHGEWHLWVMYCAWCLQRGEKFVAASEDSRSELHNAVKCIENLELHAIDLILPVFETVLTFDKDTTLRLFPIYSSEYEHWSLYTPDGNVLHIGPAAEWSYTKAK